MPEVKVGIVGATGMVGQTFMSLLRERNFPVSELRLFASEASEGKRIRFNKDEIPCQVLKNGCFEGLDLVFFSSGDDISKEWAPKAVEDGAFAVDNSGAFRMASEIDLVVPEVNAHLLPRHDEAPRIIANPNCSTIQLVVALAPIANEYGLADVRVASYQAVSGAGQAAYDELLTQVQSRDSNPKSENFPHAIAYNCIPQIGSFADNDFCSEENKIMNETRKILEKPDLRVSAFTVRVPTLNCHAEAVWFTLGKPADRGALTELLEKADGIKLLDSPQESLYPMPRMVSGEDPVYIGRLRQDPSDSETWLMWVVADNLRKGAALNGIQIAEHIFDIKDEA